MRAMPDVSQDDIDSLADKLDKLISLHQTSHSMQIDIKKQLCDLQSGHDAMAHRLRYKGDRRP